MKKTAIVALSALPLLAGCAQGDLGPVHALSLQAGSGMRTRLADYRTFSNAIPGCPTTSLPEASLLRPPLHGRFDFATGRESKAPARATCRGRRGEAIVLYYTSNRGYRGPDALSYRIRFSNGETRVVRWSLYVR